MLKYLYPILSAAGIPMKDEPNIKNAASADKCDICGDDAPSSSSWVINTEWFIDGGIPKICAKCGMVLNGAGKVNKTLYEFLSDGKRVIIYSDGDAYKAIFNYADLFKQKPGVFFFFFSRRLTLDFERIVLSPGPHKNVIVNFYNHPNYLQRYPLFPCDEIPAWAKKGYDVK